MAQLLRTSVGEADGAQHLHQLPTVRATALGSLGRVRSDSSADGDGERQVRRAFRRLVPVFVVALFVLIPACRQQAPVDATPISAPAMTTPYTVVFLTNGQAFFGKLEGLGGPYPVLTDVYYVQSQMNQQTKEVKNTLIRRGGEWHAPDRMILNAQHIIFMEPVTPNSTVGKLIDELKKQGH
jgi:hypothetical protein